MNIIGHVQMSVVIFQPQGVISHYHQIKATCIARFSFSEAKRNHLRIPSFIFYLKWVNKL